MHIYWFFYLVISIYIFIIILKTFRAYIIQFMSTKKRKTKFPPQDISKKKRKNDMFVTRFHDLWKLINLYIKNRVLLHGNLVIKVTKQCCHNRTMVFLALYPGEETTQIVVFEDSLSVHLQITTKHYFAFNTETYLSLHEARSHGWPTSSHVLLA